jgi:predicted RNA binding protein YcfA (HicA-like mRNA interferase family)
MPKFPRLTGQQVIAALIQAGFEVLREKGRNHFLSGGRHTVVHVRRGEPIGTGLMSIILRDCELERVAFLELLK